MASIHLAKGDFAELLTTPSKLFSLLQADAAAIETIESENDPVKAALIMLSQYEAAAVVRDRIQEAKRPLNHISKVEVVVGQGDFYSIGLLAHDHIVEVSSDTGQSYAVVSLIKSLVDLGGKCLEVNAKNPQTLPKSWRKLKQWQEYKWYNRPRK